MKTLLKKVYEREMFAPGWLGVFVNPFFFARRRLFGIMQPLLGKLEGVLLDIGCGTKPYKPYCSAHTYIGLELEDSSASCNADVVYDGNKLPFVDKTFHSILCTQVLEHVFEPENFLEEINRVLKIDGMMLLTVPFVWDEHEQPFDYGRYTSYGIRHLLHKYGFEIEEFHKSCQGVEAIVQLFNGYVYKVFFSSRFIVNMLVCIGIVAPVNMLGIIASLMLPKHDDIYLDNIVLVRKVRDV